MTPIEAVIDRLVQREKMRIALVTIAEWHDSPPRAIPLSHGDSVSIQTGKMLAAWWVKQ